MNIKGKTYRVVMKLLHKFNLHYAPPIYPNGDTMLWCEWCGFREVIKRKIIQEEIIHNNCGNKIEECSCENARIKVIN